MLRWNQGRVSESDSVTRLRLRLRHKRSERRVPQSSPSVRADLTF